MAYGAKGAIRIEWTEGYKTDAKVHYWTYGAFESGER